VPQQLGLLDEALAASQPIDRAIPRRRGDPCARVGRDTLLGPDLERAGEGILDRLLGEIEVTQDTNERRDRPARLLAEDALDDRTGLVRRRLDLVAARLDVGRPQAAPPADA
jgi:hypothetical protein